MGILLQMHLIPKQIRADCSTSDTIEALTNLIYFLSFTTLEKSHRTGGMGWDFPLCKLYKLGLQNARKLLLF